MTRRHFLSGSLLLTLLPVVTAGCGGGGGGTPSGLGGGSPTPITQTSGDATLVIPANDGVSAGQITMAPSDSASIPASTGLVAGTAYDLGPSGTKFSKPLALTIKYDPAQLPTGASESKLAIFTVDKGDWALVPNSTVDTTAHTVSAPVSHFSTYGILSPNTFAGLYTGHYSGDLSGNFTMTIYQSGTLKVSGNSTYGPFAGTGSLTLTGSADVTATGSGSSSGGTFAFTGNFSNPTGSQVLATGSYTDSAGDSGSWNIP